MLHFDLNLHMIDTAPKVLMTLNGALGKSAMYFSGIYVAVVHITSPRARLPITVYAVPEVVCNRKRVLE